MPKPFLELPLLVLVLSGKGGVGKTLFSLLLTDLFDLNDLPLDIVQIDDQMRLAKTIGRDVFAPELSILKKARRDPAILTASLNPIFDRIAAVADTGRSLLVDIGATQQNLLFEYASLIDLAEELDEMGVHAVAFIPTVAEPESLRQSASAITNLKGLFPGIKIFLVENFRDGAFTQSYQKSNAYIQFQEILEPHMNGIPIIRMPKIEANSWLHFERTFCRIIDAIAMNTTDVMAMTSLSRPDAKLARGDVAAFFDQMERELAAVLPFAGGSHAE